MATSVHMSVKVVAFNVNGIWRQCHELRKLQDHDIDVTLLSETYPKTHEGFFIPNYHFHLADCFPVLKGGTAVAAGKVVPQNRVEIPSFLPSFFRNKKQGSKRRLRIAKFYMQKVKVELSLCFFNSAPRHEGVLAEWRYSSTDSLTSALDGGEWSASRPCHFTPKERAPGIHWIGGWVDPRAVLDAVVKRKIPSSRRESNPRTPIIQPVAQRYTDWAITANFTWRYL
jgi:hypothetical protein